MFEDVKVPFFLAILGAVSSAQGLEFDPKPLGDGEGARLEVLSILLPAEDAAAILDGFDGTDESAADAFEQLNAKIGEGVAVGEILYREAKAVGVWNFEWKHDDEKEGAERLLALSLHFCREAKYDRVWAYGTVTPSYRFKDEAMAVKYAGETTLVGSDFAPGVIKLLGVVPAAMDRDERLPSRVRILFGKLTATEEALKMLEDHALGSPVIGVLATEVILPLAEYGGLDGLGFKDAELLETMKEQRGARILGIYAGETIHNGRIRQRAAWATDTPVHPNYGQGCLFDCDPVAVESLGGEEEPGIRPPMGAKGVLMNWFGWERNLARPEPVLTRTFQWNEGWENPGTRVIEEPGRFVKGGGPFALWLPDEAPKLAAVSFLGKEGAEDRQVIALFLRVYLRPR